VTLNIDRPKNIGEKFVVVISEAVIVIEKSNEDFFDRTCPPQEDDRIFQDQQDRSCYPV